MALIKKCEPLLERIQTFTEINVNFLSSESNVFHLDFPNSLGKVFGVTPEPNFLRTVANKLSTVCITLNEFPIIKYQASSIIARTIATIVQQDLIRYKGKNPGHWTHGDPTHPDKERAVFLILDRSFDALTPLMHDFSYQAMAYDMLTIDENKIKVNVNKNDGTIEKKDALLNESDEVWVSQRHNHIAKVIETLNGRLKEVLQNNNNAALTKGGKKMELSAMAAAVKELPEFRQTMAKLNQHVDFVKQTMDRFGANNNVLLDIFQLEQTLATGFTDNNDRIALPELYPKLVEVLENPKVDKQTKERLLAVFFITQRTTAAPKEKDALVRNAQLSPAEHSTLKNLDKINSSYAPEVLATKSVTPAKKSFFSWMSTTHEETGDSGDSTIDTRHVTGLHTILEKMIAGDLPSGKYQNIDATTAPESKSVAKSVRRQPAHTKFAGKKETFTGNRCMVFITGGISYVELRAGYDAMRKSSREVILGSTHLLTPRGYLDEISLLDKSVAVSKPSVPSDDEFDVTL
jgi:syntaxin-binding protein 1